MLKKLGILFMVSIIALSATACNNTEDATTTEQTAENEPSSSSKKKYKNISADTKPIGVDSITINMQGSSPYLSCKVYKNGGDIEESIVEVTFELFDETGKFIGEKTLTTRRSLCTGDTENISGDLIWQVPTEKRIDETLSKYTATVIAINEVDAKEAENQERLKDIIYEIEDQIDDGAYNTALTMLEMAKEEFPDSQELKLLEAQIKDKMPAASTDGTTTSAEQSSNE